MTSDGDARTREAARRLRLLFGRFADSALGRPLEGDEALAQIDESLAFLYDRAYRRAWSRGGARGAGLGPSMLAPAAWLESVEALFPPEARAALEEDAAERLGVEALFQDPAALASVTPSPAMLSLLVRLRGRIPEASLPAARRLIEEVVKDLSQKLAREMEPALSGAAGPRGRTSLKILANLDARRTVRENLRNYDPARGMLGVERLVFRRRQERHARQRLIVLLDQSGSMVDSVARAAIMAAIFASVPTIDLRLAVFDTHVVDLTEIARDPVEVLLSLQLGGGTLIERAVGYAATLVSEPRRTLVVLISDFREGGSLDALVTRIKDLLDAGVTVLGVVALGEQGAESHDRRVTRALASVGMPIGAMTPRQLAAWVGRRAGRGSP
jgi:hypothetical protein